MQVADFGSARFATQEGYHFAEQHPPEKAGEVSGSLETMTVYFFPGVCIDVMTISTAIVVASIGVTVKVGPTSAIVICMLLVILPLL